MGQSFSNLEVEEAATPLSGSLPASGERERPAPAGRYQWEMGAREKDTSQSGIQPPWITLKMQQVRAANSVGETPTDAVVTTALPGTSSTDCGVFGEGADRCPRGLVRLR
jgi:hypothetical protein